MKLKKRITVLLLAALMTFAANSIVYAHDVPDLTREGSVTVSMTYGGRPVSGGTLTMYRAGDVAENDGDYSFSLSAAFAGSQASLENIQSDRLAEQLADYARENSVSGVTANIGSTGKAVFRNVTPGLYLLVQQSAAEGYLAADPFLVSVPMTENGTYIYDVDASPKTELEKAPVTPTPEKPNPPKLPQTGQLNWPIPVFVLLGLSLYVIGWRLRTGGRCDDHE